MYLVANLTPDPNNNASDHAIEKAPVDSAGVLERPHGGIGCVGLLFLLELGLEFLDVDRVFCPE